jgi:hypothetical protein
MLRDRRMRPRSAPSLARSRPPEPCSASSASTASAASRAVLRGSRGRRRPCEASAARTSPRRQPGRDAQPAAIARRGRWRGRGARYPSPGSACPTNRTCASSRR